ncbi:E3 SUMO-protein ligase RanBP2-like isoform X4 [Biomphalaria glabrata]|uniref:Nuclear pore complex protein Nup153 n=1 Tax=Biomphalaria glabrata TaxID=6526 RepID=A0A9W2YYF4_BIOGL|nr:E3 SUMO-protein ligase RanBP2-like isoform X4 [Biomphalaria glabrata]
MFKRKQDVDKHVNAVLSRKRDDKEKSLQGFQIAKLYVDVKEYATARKYLSGFLKVREDVPQAYQLLGDINIALGNKEDALENYKKAISLGGGFVGSNRSLVKKVCELCCELDVDGQMMKFWLEKCELLCPRDEIIYKLKAKVLETVNGHDNVDKENLIASELINQPTNLSLRIKLLNSYMESGKYDEAYDNAVSTDLTTAFIDQLQWFETLSIVFQEYSSKHQDSQSDPGHNEHLLHILRNLSYLSLWKKDIQECVLALTRFDRQLKKAYSIANQDESWTAMLKEMKGQLFFLSGLLLLKKAQNGQLKWQEANHLAGACFLASRSVDPLDAQAPWFVTAPQDHSKFYSWWHLQSYDRLSQVGHMLLRLSQGELTDWTRTVKQQVMTAVGHQKVFKTLFLPRDLKEQGQLSFFYQASEMSDSSDSKEPLTERQMLEIDRVAYQVHLNDLSHLVWLCLQRYSPDKEAQPNYHFSILENIQHSVKNLDNSGAETLCQLDLLVFLLATVKCASSALRENKYLYDEHSGQPTLLPVCLSKPLCTLEQSEWWSAAYKFCTNTVKEDFSKLRRILIRGIETVRLIGSHGMSISMTVHIAKSLDAKVKSIKKSEFGCRCPAYELTALESRAAYYWEKVKFMLEKLHRNQYTPVPKQRLFKEVGDSDVDLPPRLIDKFTAESNFALALVAMNSGMYEKALEGFSTHRSPWAKYHSAQIFKLLAEQEDRNDGSEDSSIKKQALLNKARDCLYDVLDRLGGDKSHQLNTLVSNDLDDIETLIHGAEYEEREASTSSSFHTPSKFPNELRATPSTNGLVHSTPRNFLLEADEQDSGKSNVETNTGRREHNVSSSTDHYDRPRPSPERLDSQIRSLSYSQTSLFKMVLDRNEELIMINGKMMEELRDNNVQLKNVLTENKSLMEELKNFLVENRDMMKEMKSELNALKVSHLPGPTPPIPPAPPLFVPQIPAAGPPRPFPSYPPPSYGGYVINSPVPQPQAPLSAAGPTYRPSGLPGSRTSNVGKYRPQSEEDEEEEDDLSNIEREYFEHEQSYNQYFTPEAQIIQDWSVTSRPGIESQPPMSIPPLQPRMNIPAPGYFASALRGQALQYTQNTPVQPLPYAQNAPGQPLQYAQATPGQPVKATPGPGFFSSPALVTTPVVPISTPSSAKPSDASSSPALMAALTSHGSITKGISTTVSSTTPEVGASTQSESRVKSLFQARAVLEPKKTSGNMTIYFDSFSNRATVLMMSDNKEILFHHDVNALRIEPSFNPTHVIWTGIKVGSQDSQKITVSLENAALASQLKEALLKAAQLIQPKVPATQVATPSAGIGSIFAPAATTSSTPGSQKTSSTTFGGFSFNTKPIVQESKAQPATPVPNKPSPAGATSKDAAPKPFAGFTLTPSSLGTKSEGLFSVPAKADSTTPAASKPPSGPSTPVSSKSASGPLKSPAAVTKSPGGHEDDHVEDYEPNVDFKPVISLPELVEKKTGEENETGVFVERCMLFRFDHDSKQWKERGVGELKILKSKDRLKYRIVMRRDQILKLCANHTLNANLKLTPMATSDRAWCYSVMDFSEEEMKMEQLAVKFKTAEKASLFKTVFEDCCQQLQAAEESADAKEESSLKEQSKPVSTNVTDSNNSTNAKPLSELFKPKAGAWECQGCYIRNNTDVLKCPACGTTKPGAVQSTAPVKPATEAVKPLSELFKLSTGTWECGACLVRNKADVVNCAACNTLKPGAKVESTPKTGASGLASGLSSGSGGTGFKFGSASTPSAGGFGLSSSATNATSSGFIFGGPAASAGAAAPTGGFKFGAPSTSAGAPAPTGGFSFGLASTTTASSTTTTTATSTTTTTLTTTSSGFKIGATAFPTTTNSSLSGTSTVTPTATPSSSGFKFGASAPSEFSFKVNSATPAQQPTGKSEFVFGTPAKPSTVPNTSSFSFDKSTPKEATKGPDTTGLLAKLLTSEDTPVASKSQTGFNFTMPSKSNTSLSNGQPSTPGFQFSFNKSPVKSGVPESPEVDEQGLYVNKEGDDSHIHFEPVVALPDKVEVKTGEEDETILFESRGKMYRFVSGEWKEKGVGVVKILEHKINKKTRVLMRRDQVLKICCNHIIDSAISLQPMAKSDGKAWVWYALDFTEEEGQMEQLAVRFRTAEIASEFKTVFEKCCANANSTSPAKQQVEQSASVTVKKELFKVDDNTSDDVVFVGEDKPTQEQVLKARQYLLPDTFYLYENKSPCPGCIGCNDGELPATASSTVATSKATPEPKSVAAPVATPVASSAATSAQKNSQVKAAVPSLFGEDSAGKSSFMFGSNVTVDFSSLASSTSAQGFTWKKAESSSPFHFAGAGQKLFGGGTSSSPSGGGAKTEESEEGDDTAVAPSDDIHFEPVIPLPDLVEVKTGEEDWSPLFCERAKLYKFDKSLGQWKERGIGDMKIMKHTMKIMFRILQRREQVLKVSCNHLISVDMDLKPMATSETAWCWVATDYTDTEPSIEQFAVKFKNKELASKFKDIFEQCQRDLQAGEQVTPDQEGVSKIHKNTTQLFSLHVSQQGTTDLTKKTSLMYKPFAETESTYHFVTPLGDKGNRHHTKALDVSGQDEILSASYTPLGGAKEPSLKSTFVTPLGDKGNRHHTKALDVSGQDEILPASYTPLGGAKEPSLKSTFVTPLGDKGNIHHTKALDVSGQDEILPASYTPLGGAKEPTLKSTFVTPLGDKGNIHHTKALDVSGQDEILPASYTPLGGAKEPSLKSTFVTPLGDKGNRQHTKALDVSGQDEILPASYTPLGGAKEPSLKSTFVTPLGDKGNRQHTKALDVSGQDEILPASYTPLGGAKEPTLKSTFVTPLGDKGNIHHTKALDVSGQDEILPASYTPLGGAKEPSLKSTFVTPLGDKGNIHHTKALDVSGQDEILPASYTPLGGAKEPSLKSTFVTPLGDKGNRQHTKALDVSGQDEILPASYTPLGGAKEPSLKSTFVTPLGDKGNRQHTKALDVSGQDEILPASYTPLGGAKEPSLKSTFVTPLGDKGNIHHTKALDVSGQDEILPASYTPLGGAKEPSLKSTFVTPLSDKGNRHHTKALDVSGQDEILPASYTPLGGAKEPSLKSTFVTPLGDKGNRHHTKALDVSGQDEILPASYTPLGGAKEPTLKSTFVTPLGDKGNRHHTKALDVSGQDEILPASYTPLGGAKEPTLKSTFVTPLGDKGNRHHTKALDVSGQDEILPASYTPLGGAKEPSLKSTFVTPLGDKGNRHHTKALDVSGQDEILPASYTPLGGAKEPSLKSTFVTPLGDKGNRHHTKALDVSGQDEILPASYTPLGGAKEPTLKSTFVTPLGDKGNIHHTKALDVSGQDEILPASYTPLGGVEQPVASKAPAPTEGVTVVEADEGQGDYGEYNEEEEEEDGDKVLLDKRVTLSSFENGSWKKLSVGTLQVKFNEDVGGHSVEFMTDNGERMCNHVICQEHHVHIDVKKHTCEWQPIDYSTDEPIRKHFSAQFSSAASAEEFAQIFQEGQQQAAEFGISENVLNEIDVPEIFSGGALTH